MIQAGVDEAGRGPLAGPVVVGAVILDANRPIEGLADSKRLTARRRELLDVEIRQHALAWHVEVVDAETIDRVNILQATMLGMQRAVESLDPVPELVLVDGNRAPKMPCACRAIVKGDQLEPAISAASILAKVHRDRLMQALHHSFPVYGFDRHKGYPTRAHLEALARIGPCPQHRRSFAPVREALSRQSRRGRRSYAREP